MKRSAGPVFFALAIGVFALAVWLNPNPSQFGSHTIETIEGNMRTIDRIDAEGNRHGRQEIHVDGVMVYEAEVEHGHLLWLKEYNADGSLKLSRGEGE